MKLWRITRARYQQLDGEGARQHGGRWNSEGRPVVYAASSPSLAALELLVHVDIEDLPTDMVLIEIDVPDDALPAEVHAQDLPAEWNTTPDHPECIRRGDAWLADAEKLLLKVPSAVMPQENNVLINPAHTDFGTVQISSVGSFHLDRRLVRE
jgi:RES domain-containing protein